MLPRPTAHDSTGEDVDSDLELLLGSAEPLFQSRNPAVSKRDPSFPLRASLDEISQVVMSVARVFYYLALPSQHHKIVHPLLRLLAMSLEVERVVLAYILSISHTGSVSLVRFRAYLNN